VAAGDGVCSLSARVAGGGGTLKSYVNTTTTPRKTKDSPVLSPSFYFLLLAYLSARAREKKGWTLCFSF